MSFTAEYQARLAGPWTDIRDQLALLHLTAAGYPWPRICEFGVRTGESTCAFLAAAEQAGGHVWSWDVAEPQVPGHWLASPLWTFTRGRSETARLPGCDILFIDTSHEHAQTLAELRHLAPAVLAGGRILLHDTKLDDPPFEPLAVARAADDWCKEAGRSWRELGGRYGLGEIVIEERTQ